MENIPEIHGYRFGERLGTGAIAVVYSGFHIETGLRVAIKILKPSMLVDSLASKRFLKEADTVSKLKHPHIIQIFQFGYTGPYPYLIMEYLPHTLRRRMSVNSNPLPLLEKLNIIGRISRALDYAHGRGVIHRDIKPDNIMLRRDEDPVLADFGLVKISGSKDCLTRSGVTVGTPDYMSPEQIQGLSVGPATDIYSLGVVLYEMLTGYVPYRASNYVTLAMKHLKKRVPRLPRKYKQIQHLLNCMMAKDLRERCRGAGDVIQLLKAPPFHCNISEL